MTVHCIILGRAGACYKHTISVLEKLGLNKSEAEDLLTALHHHATTKLREIILNAAASNRA